MTVVNKIIHRFVRDRADYEQGGSLYDQIIPYNTQAYSYKLKENGDPSKPEDYLVYYVLGTGKSTYIEIAEGRGEDLEGHPVPELSREFLITSHTQLETIIKAVLEINCVQYTQVGDHKTINLTDKNSISVEINGIMYEVFGQSNNGLTLGSNAFTLNLASSNDIVKVNNTKTVATEESVAAVYLTKQDAADTYTTIDDFDDHRYNYNNPHQVTKAQVGLGNCDNTSDLNKPISTATQTAITNEETARITGDNSLATALQTEVTRATDAEATLQKNINTEAKIRSDADSTLQTNINNEATTRSDADSALDTKITNVNTALGDEVTRATGAESTLNTSITNVDGRVTIIENKIPTAAAPTNQLADKQYVNDLIITLSANYVTYNAAGEPFPTKAALNSATVWYIGGVSKIPAKNDYTIVTEDEDHVQAGGIKPTCRYLCTDVVEDVPVWNFQYIVNNTPFTQQQWNAINSTITVENVTGDGTSVPSIKNNAENISSLSSSVSTLSTTVTTHISNKDNPHDVTKEQVGLGNCDNTSDADKPISSATQTALGAKANAIQSGTKDNIVTIADDGKNIKDSGAKITTSVAVTESNTNILTGLAVKTYVDNGLATKQDVFTAQAPLKLANNQLTISTFTAPTTQTGGKSGIVPAPVAGTSTRFLCVDGTWKELGFPTRYEMDLSSQLNGSITSLVLTEEIGSDYDIYYNGQHLRSNKQFQVEGTILKLLITAPKEGEDMLVVYRK